MRLAGDTMEELEWCLDQLETIQTHRSVSDMASLKVRVLFIRKIAYFINTLFQPYTNSLNEC